MFVGHRDWVDIVIIEVIVARTRRLMKVGFEAKVLDAGVGDEAC